MDDYGTNAKKIHVELVLNDSVRTPTDIKRLMHMHGPKVNEVISDEYSSLLILHHDLVMFFKDNEEFIVSFVDLNKIPKKSVPQMFHPCFIQCEIDTIWPFMKIHEDSDDVMKLFLAFTVIVMGESGLRSFKYKFTEFMDPNTDLFFMKAIW